jgi:hypothetical protein
LDDNFLTLFATNLFHYIEEDDRHGFAYTLEDDGYFLNNDLQFYKDKIVFKVNFNHIDHVVTVNDLVISRPQGLIENANVMDYLFKRPNQKIKLIKNSQLEVKGSENIIPRKTICKIINQLGFKGLASKIFFPSATNKLVEFRNPITVEELKRRGIKETLTLEDLFPDAVKRNKTN